MRINLEEAAREMWELWGKDAERIAAETAEKCHARGETKAAKEWEAIAQACRIQIGPSPHPKRPYGKLKPLANLGRKSSPKPGLRQLLMDV